MKLTQDHIQKLFRFTRKHYVEHYDLQTELVDHLAHGIEEQWQKNPELSFDEALQREFEKFGVFGFMGVVEEKSAAMRKKYLIVVLGFFKDFFKLPKVLLTVFLVGLVTIIIWNIPIGFRYGSVLGILFAHVIVVFFVLFKNRSNNELEMVKQGNKWLLKDQIYSYGNWVNFLNLFPILLNTGILRGAMPMDTIWVILGFATLIVLTGIPTYIILYIVPSKAEELLANTYPEYNFEYVL
ncbi:hypothetical protein [Cytophaga sp. FL35]|uniref:hypothetical protein n=1 Tax=Cytophaga sp. FL35 TaxID=1904456 RepID=UPI001653E937|nr:hypothetical protein [Cytophaga sp. FL35]MBC6997524.1 hypothetical protein [Cytophaga sp. FL35]